MNDMKNYQLYERLKKIFKQMEPNKILLIAALTLERLWQPIRFLHMGISFRLFWLLKIP